MSAQAISTHRQNIEVWPRSDASMTPAIVTSTARVPTKFALEYLGALIGDVSLSPSPTVDTTIHAEITLPAGLCKLEANRNHLNVTLVAKTNSDAAQLEALISDRLEDLAWGEVLQYQWRRAATRKDHQSLSSHLGDPTTMAGRLFGGLIASIALGFLLWQFF